MDSPIIKLIEQARKGEESSFKPLILATQDRLYRFCLVLTGDQQMAEDLCQESLVRILRSLSELKSVETYFAWTCRIAKNLFVDQSKSKKSSILNKASAYRVESAQEDGVEQALAVHQVLSQLETADRLVLLFVDMEGCSYGEAALALGVSEDAVRSRLFRARKFFIEKWQSVETKQAKPSS